MTTSILFTLMDGVPTPSVSSIRVAQGETFELSVTDGSKAVVYFSPALAANVSPAPGASVTLVPGNPARFTFVSSGPGAYSLIATGESDAAPLHFRTAPSSHVSLQSNFRSANIAYAVDGGRTASNN